jgi:chaperonin GroES
MSIKPLGDRILVEIIEAESVTASGLVIPDAARDKPSEALVVSIGASAQGIEIGDKVVFSKYGGTEVLHDGASYLLLSYKDVLAIVE